jgi:hypothetical protein
VLTAQRADPAEIVHDDATVIAGGEVAGRGLLSVLGQFAVEELREQSIELITGEIGHR